MLHAEMSSVNVTMNAYYIFNTGDGFVIVAGDDRAEQILGYGDDELDMNDIPCCMQFMLDSYKEAKFSYNGKKMTEYEVSQEMRGMERDIRETKREIAGLQAAYDAAEDPKLKADLKADLEKALL